jgi:hypothetical protein
VRYSNPATGSGTYEELPQEVLAENPLIVNRLLLAPEEEQAGWACS